MMYIPKLVSSIIFVNGDTIENPSSAVITVCPYPGEQAFYLVCHHNIFLKSNNGHRLPITQKFVFSVAAVLCFVTAQS